MDGKYSVEIRGTRIINGELYIKIEVVTPKIPPTKSKKTDAWFKWIRYNDAVSHHDKVEKFDNGKKP